MLAIEFSEVVVVLIPTSSGSLTWCAGSGEYVVCPKFDKLCSGVVKRPTTGLFLATCFVGCAEKDACVGVRADCIAGGADDSVG